MPSSESMARHLLKRRALGLCETHGCPFPRAPGRCRCAFHERENRLCHRALNARRLAAGLCARCGRRPPRPGVSSCRECATRVKRPRNQEG